MFGCGYDDDDGSHDDDAVDTNDCCCYDDDGDASTFASLSVTTTYCYVYYYYGNDVVDVHVRFVSPSPSSDCATDTKSMAMQSPVTKLQTLTMSQVR